MEVGVEERGDGWRWGGGRKRSEGWREDSCKRVKDGGGGIVKDERESRLEGEGWRRG